MIKDKKNVNKPKTNGVNGTSKPIWSTTNSRKMGGSTKTFSSRSDTPSSILSSDSDIRFTRKFSRNVRGPCCVLATFLVALLVAGIMYYLGYKYLTLEPGGERRYRGMFQTSRDGDQIFTSDLSDPSTARYQTLAMDYRDLINILFKKSHLKSAYMGTDILAFDGNEGFPLVVHFNLKFYPRRHPLDVRDLEEVLKSNRTIDPDSVRIQEGEMLTALMQVSSTTTTTTTEAPKAVTTCDPVQLSFCRSALSYNLTAYPNIFGHMSIKDVEDDMIAFRELVDAECYQHTYEFVCQILQPSCVKASPEDQMSLKASPEDQVFLPCRQFCNDFWVGCGNRLPARFKEALNCFRFPQHSHVGSMCSPKAASCEDDLRQRGLASRLCDGLADCADLSDEIACPYCQAGFIHCGTGKNCVPGSARCDGVQDCPNGSDELGCLSLAPNVSVATSLRSTIPPDWFSAGYVVFNEKGLTGKVCVDRLNQSVADLEGTLGTIAMSLCHSLKYKEVKEVRIKTDDDISGGNILGRYVHIEDPYAAEITFVPAACPEKQVLSVACNYPECGVQPARGVAEGVQGLAKSAALGDWPWHTALLKDGVHVCDATLVADQWLLTSVSCFQGLGKAQWTARFGSVRLSTSSPWQQDRLIEGMVKSPVEGSSMVLLKLNRPIKFTDFIRPICLTPPGTRLPNVSFCQSLGWSHNKETLQRIELKEIPMEKCENMSITQENSICTDSIFERSDCKEEELAGSPMICLFPDNRSWTLVGLSNWRQSCTPPGMQRPRLYDKVSSNVDWIHNTLKEK
ncbi:hypothetical protein M8J77_007523 [Diaphorina citri]|nr:hypothetical protein M8J77_007523 [Diaphorina citri]